MLEIKLTPKNQANKECTHLRIFKDFKLYRLLVNRSNKPIITFISTKEVITDNIESTTFNKQT